MNVTFPPKFVPILFFLRKNALILIPVGVFIVWGIIFYFSHDFDLMSEFKSNARKINIHEYDLTVIPDFSLNSLNVKTKIRLEVRREINEIYFMVGNMIVDDIRYQNNSLHFMRTKNVLKVFFPEVISRDETIELTLNSHSRFDSIIRKDGTIDSMISHDYSIVRYQSGWYPRIPNDTAKSMLRIKSLPGKKVIANGKFLTEEKNELETIVTYEYPHENRFSFIIDTYETDVKTHDNVSLELSYGLKNIGEMNEVSEQVMNIISFYREILGAYPFLTLKLVITKEMYPGDRNCPNMIMVHENFLDSPPEELHFFLAKEIAFQWFGNFITTNEFTTAYYIPALAEYLALTYSEVQEPHDVFTKRLRTLRNIFFYHREFDPGFDEPLQTTQNQSLMLSKGVYVFHMLRNLIGEHDFYALLAELVKNKQKKYVSRKSLVALLHEITQKNYAWFFSEWEDRQGAPAYEWMYGVEHDKITQNTHLTIEITQKPVYETPIPISVTTDTGTIDKMITVKESESLIRFEVPHSVKEVLFDPQMTILRDNDERRLSAHEEEKMEPLKNALHRVIELGTVNPIETHLEMNSPYLDELYFNLNLLAHLKAKKFRVKKILALTRSKDGKNLEVIMGIATNSNRINETITLNLVNNFDSLKIYRMKYETM